MFHFAYDHLISPWPYFSCIASLYRSLFQERIMRDYAAVSVRLSANGKKVTCLCRVIRDLRRTAKTVTLNARVRCASVGRQRSNDSDAAIYCCQRRSRTDVLTVDGTANRWMPIHCSLDMELWTFSLYCNHFGKLGGLKNQSFVNNSQPIQPKFGTREDR